MPITSGSFPKALLGGSKVKKTTGASKSAIKADKAMDKKMTPKQLAKDISADKKLLASKKKGK